ncbi:MAG: sporulation protein [Candidatus Burarchaeum sp.]|nr:sporulation protein [Candidatus Burarchaeum sp.]MDO8340003.1 sporulation protein [Candidatus Burarchaeum sp.]
MFGFGAGSIDVKLNNFNYKPGDTIEGTVVLNLKGPMKARGLFIALTALRRERSGKHTSDRTVFELKNTLDGEKEYAASPEPIAYPFKIVVPQQIPNQGQIPQIPGEVGGAVTDLLKFFVSSQQVKWYLIAKLDVPMASDVSKQVQINIA